MSEWKLLARCRGGNPETWFPDTREEPTEAKRICGLCEVRAECLAYALSRDERFGVWGGLTPQERRDLQGEAT